MVTATTYIRVSENIYIHESEWLTQFDAMVEQGALDIHFIRSKIVIAEDGQDRTVFEDCLGPLVQNLCLFGSKHLLAGQDYKFNYWNYEGEVRMILKGDEVRVEGDFLQPALYPRRELTKALLDCAQKVIEFLKTVQTKKRETEASSIVYLEKLYLEVMESYLRTGNLTLKSINQNNLSRN